MKNFLIIASFLVLVFSVETTYACTCRDIDPNKDLERKVAGNYQDAFAVFSGKVLSIKNLKPRNKIVTLRLNRSWKGNFGRSVTISTSFLSSMCGYPFANGKTYLIYAFGPNRQDLSTSVCTRTAEISQTKDLTVLDAIKKKT